MKGLRKVLTPFAPDQSGAVSVLYSLGGILIIVDAGGCAGNICGFDEPRWSSERSAVFSAGLRDMDAVMGRDRLLIKKTVDCVRKLKANFVAFVGTPVPAVIGTDFSALKRMLDQKLSELSLPPLPVLAIPTDGMHTFDRGESLAYLSLLQELAERNLFAAIPVDEKRVGLFGVSPLDLPEYDADRKRISAALRREGFSKIIFYGADADFSAYRNAPANVLNIAVSEDGVAACSFLQEKFKTPYRVDFPGADDYLKILFPDSGQPDTGNTAEAENLPGGAQSILIVNSSVFAQSLGKAILQYLPTADVTIASWFASKNENVFRLREEDDFTRLVTEQKSEIIMADEVQKKLIPDYSGTFIHIPEFALSGKRRA